MHFQSNKDPLLCHTALVTNTTVEVLKSPSPEPSKTLTGMNQLHDDVMPDLWQVSLLRLQGLEGGLGGSLYSASVSISESHTSEVKYWLD